MLVHVVRFAELDDLAEVHDRDVVADVAHHGKVVRDEDVREPELVLQVLEQVDDAGLDRHVERRDRLVEHQQLRVERQRPRDADALALTAGELVREPVHVFGVEPDERHQLLDAIDLFALAQLVDLERLTDDRADRHPRIQRRVRILEHELHLLTERADPDLSCVSTSVPRNCTEPDVGSISRRMQRPVVLLPQPDSPTMPSVRPGYTEKLTPETACTAPT